MSNIPANVLVFTPHPDDAEFGVAGSVVHWVKEGKSVVYVVCTNGNKGTNDPDMKPEQLATIREEEQLAAAKTLGVREVVFLRHPDQELEDTPEFRKEIVRLIRIYQPETVITADPYRQYLWHRDHRIAGRVVLDAVFPYARDLYSYPDLIEEGIQPHKVREVLLWGAEDLNCRFNISDTFEQKITALRCHKSQVGKIPVGELEERLRQRCQMMAQGQDYELAEAFHQVEIWW